LRDSSLYSNKQ